MDPHTKSIGFFPHYFVSLRILQVTLTSDLFVLVSAKPSLWSTLLHKLNLDAVQLVTDNGDDVFKAILSGHSHSQEVGLYTLKGQYHHDQSSFSTGHGISVLV